MASGYSNWGKNYVLDVIFGNDSPEATYYIGLVKSDIPTVTDTGASIDEVSGGSYSRVAMTNNTTNFPGATDGAKEIGTVVTFPTASADWGTVKYFVICDASTNGNLVGWGQLAVAKTINNGQTARFPIGSLRITQNQ